MARERWCDVTAISVIDGPDLEALGPVWRQLEARADGSFFLSWSWIGCLAAERFTDPVLVEATEQGRVVALALFNRRRSRFGRGGLWLHASGAVPLDCPYIEQNGVLAEAGREEELTAACLRAVVRRYTIVLSGVDERTAAACQRVAPLAYVRRTQPSPFADLASLRAAGTDYLDGRSANTRQQIRRSDRSYAQGDGSSIRVRAAGSVREALTMLDAMSRLHQACWIIRGQPGSFAEPFFGRFHRALIEQAWPRGEVALLEVSSREAIIGFLYNFAYRGRMLAYQSGFAYEPVQTAAAKAKPGLTCHHAAIRYAIAQGFDVYDFLAGRDRYKRSLAESSHNITWMEAGPVWSLGLMLRCLAARFRARISRFDGGE